MGLYQQKVATGAARRQPTHAALDTRKTSSERRSTQCYDREMMVTINKQSLADQVYNALLDSILKRELPEGSRIVIDRVSKEYGVSLIPVREALARLNAHGLVNYVSNQGYRVAPSPTVEDYAHLFEARRAIECGALYVGFPSLNDKTISSLEEINAEIREITNPATEDGYWAFTSLNERFHDTLISLTKNPELVKVYDRIGYSANVGRRMMTRGVPDIQNNILEHERIIAELRLGDKIRAVQALDDHIVEGYSRFRANSGNEQMAKAR